MCFSRITWWQCFSHRHTVYINKYCIIYSNIEVSQWYTVKPVFKGHRDEKTTCNQGTFSQNGVLSSLCQRTCDEGTLCLGYRGILEDRFHCMYILLWCLVWATDKWTESTWASLWGCAVLVLGNPAACPRSPIHDSSSLIDTWASPRIP